METFEVIAEPRTDTGKGASRRLRRNGRVPAIVYGGDKEPQGLSLDHNDTVLQLKNERFYSHILDLKVAGASERVVLKDLQRHPSKPHILHLDFQRVDASHRLHMKVPLHFVNEERCPGKKAGGMVSHNLTEVDISCLPQHLPEFIAVDLGNLKSGGIIHLNELVMPEGVTLASHLPEDEPVVSVTKSGLVGTGGAGEEGEE